MEAHIKTLKALCEAATPGPWNTESDGSPALNNVTQFIVSTKTIVAYGQLTEADAAYIAAASPDAILKLLEERDRLREALTKIANHFDDSWVVGCIERQMGDVARQALEEAR